LTKCYAVFKIKPLNQIKYVICVLYRLGVRIWCFNATFNNFQLYRGGQVFFGGGNRGIRRKLPTCRKSPTTLSPNVASSAPRHERDSNTKLLWW